VTRHGATALFLVALSALAGCSSDDEEVRAGAQDAGSSTTAFEGVDDDGRRHVGDNAVADVAIFFKAEVSDDGISDFIGDVLSKPPQPGRRGQDNLDGLDSIAADYGRHAVYLQFFDNATAAQRQAVKDAVLASPLVDRIEEGIVPAEKYPDPTTAG
jgi:hypothetical protein